jgi:hypothetical protein
MLPHLLLPGPLLLEMRHLLLERALVTTFQPIAHDRANLSATRREPDRETCCGGASSLTNARVNNT